MTKLYIEKLIMPGAALGEENPLPMFRTPKIHTRVATFEPFPREKLAFLGWETGFRVLPYRMQDQYTREKTPLTFNAVVLQNEWLKATFLPELGGRLVSLAYRPEDRELLQRNPVFQPANLAIRNAWFSGGIEWNIGQLGHTFHTCSPVFGVGITGSQDEPGLRLYEFERCKRLFWQIDFYLPPDLPFLVAYTRVINPNPTATSMYWWTNTAVDERAGVRVLAPAEKALYLHFGEGTSGFGETQLPNLPSLHGADGTYPLNTTFANEFFFQCDQADLPWEAALDENGTGFFEASTRRLAYRKLFCWGTHAGGRHWQEFLSQPGEAYCEIQAGLAPTQLHGLPMPADTSWDWLQVFGKLEAPPELVHGKDWTRAWQTVDQVIKDRLPIEKMSELHQECASRADQAPGEQYQAGSGWGALELHRRARAGQAAPPPFRFSFPDSTLGDEQAKWLTLLEEGIFPEQRHDRLPGEWMVQEDWENHIDQSLQKEGNRHWVSLLHKGVMRLEVMDDRGAASAWEESLACQPSVWANRNLAVLALRQNHPEKAFAYYHAAWQLAEQANVMPAGLAVEFIKTLLDAGEHQQGMQVYNRLPAKVRDTDRIQILRARLALAMGDLDSVEEVLNRDYAVVQEGEMVLTDLWYELHTLREARRTGRPIDDNLRREVKRRFPPPKRIDFRGTADEVS